MSNGAFYKSDNGVVNLSQICRIQDFGGDRVQVYFKGGLGFIYYEKEILKAYEKFLKEFSPVAQDDVLDIL